MIRTKALGTVLAVVLSTIAANPAVAATAPEPPNVEESVLAHDPNGVRSDGDSTRNDELARQLTSAASLSVGGISVDTSRLGDNFKRSRVGVTSSRKDSRSTSVGSAIDSDGTQGVRISHVLNRGASDEGLSYPITIPTGHRLQLTESGAVVVTDASGSVVVGGMAPPWAVDSNGTRVPARYMVSSNVVTLKVDLSQKVAYPLVADPFFWWGATNCGNITCSIYFSRSQSRQTNQDMLAYGIQAAVICIMFGLVPVVGIALGAGCSIWFVWWSYTITQAGSTNTCAKLTYNPFTLLVAYASTNNGYYCIN